MAQKSNFGVGIAIGAILGGVATFFMSPRSGKENRDMAKKKIGEFKKMINDKKIDEAVKEIYGSVTEEGKKFYTMARKEIDIKLSDLQKNLKDIDQSKYKQIVMDTVDYVVKEGKTTIERVDKLKKYLLNRWNTGEDMVKSDVKKVVKK